MTNEYKLAPSVPTEDMREEGYIANIGPAGTYQAMLKDAPTLQEVDLEELKHQYVEDVGAYASLGSFAGWIEQKHGKLYAVKGE